MKKILFFMFISMLFVGVASAASLWGSYKGNQIIRLTVDSVPIKVSDVPAINFNGRTMLPIYLLQQAGVQYSWDQKNQTVDITTTKQITKYGLNDLTTEVRKYDVDAVAYSSDGNRALIIYYYKFNSETLDKNLNNLTEIIRTSTYTDAVTAAIHFNDNSQLSMPVDKVKDFFSGVITGDQLSKYYTMSPGNEVNQQSSVVPTTCEKINTMYDEIENRTIAQLIDRGLLISSVTKVQLMSYRNDELARASCPVMTFEQAHPGFSSEK